MKTTQKWSPTAAVALAFAVERKDRIPVPSSRVRSPDINTDGQRSAMSLIIEALMGQLTTEDFDAIERWAVAQSAALDAKRDGK